MLFLLRSATVAALLALVSVGNAAPLGATTNRLAAERAAAAKALAALPGSQRLTVIWPPHHSRPTTIRNLDLAIPGKDLESRARSFLGRYPALLQAAHATLRLAETRTANGLTVVRFAQLVGGVPVLDAVVAVAIDSRGHVTSVTDESEAIELRQPQPVLTAQAAVEHAARTVLRAAAGGGGGASLPPALRATAARLVVLPGNPARLAYALVLPLGIDPSGRIHLVNATDGRTIGWRRGVLLDGKHSGTGVTR